MKINRKLFETRLARLHSKQNLILNEASIDWDVDFLEFSDDFKNLEEVCEAHFSVYDKHCFSTSLLKKKL